LCAVDFPISPLEIAVFQAYSNNDNKKKKKTDLAVRVLGCFYYFRDKKGHGDTGTFFCWKQRHRTKCPGKCVSTTAGTRGHWGHFVPALSRHSKTLVCAGFAILQSGCKMVLHCVRVLSEN
jgi:hypothetical protein